MPAGFPRGKTTELERSSPAGIPSGLSMKLLRFSQQHDSTLQALAKGGAIGSLPHAYSQMAAFPPTSLGLPWLPPSISTPRAFHPQGQHLRDTPRSPPAESTKSRATKTATPGPSLVEDPKPPT